MLWKIDFVVSENFWEILLSPLDVKDLHQAE